MEKKCKYCAMMIPVKAKICPHCSKKQGMSALRKLVAVLIIILLVSGIRGIYLWKEYSANGVMSGPASTRWTYDESKDEMTGKVTKSATRASIWKCQPKIDHL